MGPITFYTPGLSTGGIGKMRLHLMEEMVRRGLPVDLVVSDTSSPLLAALPKEVTLFTVATTHGIWSLYALSRYLRARRPTAVVTDRLRLNTAVLRARSLARVPVKVLLSFHNPLSVKMDGLSPSKKDGFRKRLLKCSRGNEKFVAVSRGVADELVRGLGIPEDRVQVVPNPVIRRDIPGLAAQAVHHPFFEERVPVLITAGRMTEQKDFPTLFKAFRRILDRMDCRLLVLGDHGKHYHALRNLAEDLGIARALDLTGFKANPYKYLARADVFVLSSRWEGFGNVLVEALAVGTPVVSTDCPVGPREILENGRWGRLVPVGDPDRLAAAVEETLANPPRGETLMRAAATFTVEKSTDGYLEALGLG
ncbi:MAG: glycosyl transferase [Desulfacinum sp.]|jgi:glycosyltransferase involved in cell wall biosynthesis|nr:glycosyl transferase [Desulfacinum sp.]